MANREISVKVFGTSINQIISSAYGQPLLQVPLNQVMLNLIGTTFQCDDLARLGQFCGDILRRLNTDSSARHSCLSKSQELIAQEDFAEFYEMLDVRLVILLHGSCVGIPPEQASKLITTYFLELEQLRELLQETN